MTDPLSRLRELEQARRELASILRNSAKEIIELVSALGPFVQESGSLCDDNARPEDRCGNCDGCRVDAAYDSLIAKLSQT